MQIQGERENQCIYVLLNTLLHLALHFSLLCARWLSTRLLIFSWTFSLCFIFILCVFVCYACLVQSTTINYYEMYSCSEKISLSLCTEEQPDQEKHINCLFSNNSSTGVYRVQSTPSHLFVVFVAYINTFSSFLVLCCCCLVDNMGFLFLSFHNESGSGPSCWI